jgi:DNA-binding MarR family transcriptional regulator
MTGMSAIDTAKEIVRITSTAGLSKDVIDLLEKKNALLAEQITSLETENSNLKKKVEGLEQQLEHVRPKGELQPDAVRFLKVMFQQGSLPVSQIAAALGMEKGMADYHRDQLLQAKMVGWPMVGTMGRESSLLLLPKGRAYLVEHGHV